MEAWKIGGHHIYHFLHLNCSKMRPVVLMFLLRIAGNLHAGEILGNLFYNTVRYERDLNCRRFFLDLTNTYSVF